MMLMLAAADINNAIFNAFGPLNGVVLVFGVLGALLRPVRKAKGNRRGYRTRSASPADRLTDWLADKMSSSIRSSGGRSPAAERCPTSPAPLSYSELIARPAPDKEVVCPSCANTCRISTTSVSKDVECARCHLVFTVSARAGQSPADKTSTPAVNRGVAHVFRTHPSAWSVEALQQLEWWRFEVVCPEFLNTVGFQAKETKTGADGGVDIVLHRTGDSKPMAIAQCKAWRTRPVGVKPVRELYGVMAAEKVEHGIFLTTSAYTQEANEFAAGKKLELVDGAKLMAFIRQLNANA